MDRAALLEPITAGLLPDRRRLAEVIAALSRESHGHVVRPSDIQDGIDAGMRYWCYNGRYWEGWWPGDLGTMGMDPGPESVAEAWDIVVARGFVPADWGDVRRRFCVRTSCLGCRRPLEGRCAYCSSEHGRVEEVAPSPTDVELCAMIACDPTGMARAEQIARRLAGDPATAIAWRVVKHTALTRSLVDAELEAQYPLLELGYAIDPLAVWDDGVVLAIPALDE